MTAEYLHLDPGTVYDRKESEMVCEYTEDEVRTIGERDLTRGRLVVGRCERTSNQQSCGVRCLRENTVTVSTDGGDHREDTVSVL